MRVDMPLRGMQMQPFSSSSFVLLPFCRFGLPQRRRVGGERSGSRVGSDRCAQNKAKGGTGNATAFPVR